MRIARLFFISVLCGPVLCAQSCPQSNVYEAAPVEEVLHADRAEVVFKYAAIAGNTIAPALLRLSKPDMTVDSVAGAAQVSLARLGDKTALGELEEELNDSKTSYRAVPKLARVGSDAAVAMLMTYLRAHVSDPSIPRNVCDYCTDLRSTLVGDLSEQLHIGPVGPDGSSLTASWQEWMAWWDQNKGKPIVLSISGEFRDPYLQCLARKVEWGFPDAIFDMVRTPDPQVIPILRLWRDLAIRRDDASL